MSDFLMGTNVVGVIIGLMISSQAINLVNAFVDSFISPIITYLFNRASERVGDITINVGGIQLRIAIFIAALIRFIIIIGIVYCIYNMNTKLMKRN